MLLEMLARTLLLLETLLALGRLAVLLLVKLCLDLGKFPMVLALERLVMLLLVLERLATLLLVLGRLAMLPRRPDRRADRVLERTEVEPVDS